MSDSRVVLEEFIEIVWSLKNKKSCVIVSGLFVEKFVEICRELLVAIVVFCWSFEDF